MYSQARCNLIVRCRLLVLQINEQIHQFLQVPTLDIIRNKTSHVRQSSRRSSRTDWHRRCVSQRVCLVCSLFIILSIFKKEHQRTHLLIYLLMLQSISSSICRFFDSASSQSIHASLRHSRVGLDTACRLRWDAFLAYLACHGTNYITRRVTRIEQPIIRYSSCIFSHSKFFSSCFFPPKKN